MSEHGLLIRGSEIADIARKEAGSFYLVQRDRLGLGEVSVAVSENPPGVEVATHRHSCGEVFVVFGGRGIYTVGKAEIVAVAGDMVVVPARTWHSFRADGENSLRHVAVYDGGRVDIEFAAGPAGSG